jgi:hypothetical protein
LEKALSTFDLNYTLQDIIGAAFAFFLFPLVIVFPGYVAGWALDIFEFRLRQPIVRLGMGLILSFAISPIIFDLTSSLFPANFSLITIGGFAVAVIAIVKGKTTSTPESKRHTKILLWVGLAWVIFTILSLVDIQWKDQLYFSVVSFDQTSRVSVINAMTRTGVPPINPGYYPGSPVQLNFLYYFWYILASLIDRIGGTIVDSRAALNASSAWAGLGLMSVVALYLQMRNANSAAKSWFSAKIGLSLLTVSGLDVLPSAILAAGVGSIYGTIESWNSQMEIPTWISSVLWAPHHIAALIAGLSAILLAQSARNKPASRKFTLLSIAGMAFASSLGLSMWVTLLFVIFWGIWIIALLVQKVERSQVLSMVFSGIIAILLASPFILGLLNTGSDGGTGQSPIIFDIRTLYLLEVFIVDWAPIWRWLLMLALLPLNYFLELGFFFMAGFYWLKTRSKAAIKSNPFYFAEVILMAVVLLIGSTLRSTLANNDLGWRVWLPGQFILLIWGVDIVEFFLSHKNNMPPSSDQRLEVEKTKKLLITLALLGILTSSIDAFFLRVTLPLRIDPETARQNYSARLVYDYLRDHIPADIITQDNPLNSIDRPSGLYGTHQMVIADRTAYGVPTEALRKFVNEIGVIFTARDMNNWQTTDRICRQYSIDILIINDANPVWDSLSKLKVQRAPLYENSHYTLFACGNYAQGK